MKIAILTVYTDNYKPLADIVIPNLERYCKKHNYRLFAYDITGTDIYYGYNKIDKLIGILNKDIDVVLCLDLDALITNHNTKIESFIDSNHDFYITKDVNGINAGSFIVCNSPWAKDFLRKIYSLRDTFECEQPAIESFKLEANIKILLHPSINSYIYDEYGPTWGVIGNREINKPTHEEGNWENGDFVLHLPGIPLERRIEIFKSLKHEIIL